MRGGAATEHHMRKILIGLVLGTSILASPAMARDGSVYAGIEGGLLFGDDLYVDFDIDGDGDIDTDAGNDVLQLNTDMGWDIDAVVGYDFGRFRLEAEAGYKTADIDGVESDGFDLDPSTPAIDTAFDVDGGVDVTSVMANGL